MMGLSSAPTGLTSWAAGSPLKSALYVVTTRPAVSLRAGCAMATQTVLTRAMSKDAVSTVQLIRGRLHSPKLPPTLSEQIAHHCS